MHFNSRAGRIFEVSKVQMFYQAAWGKNNEAEIACIMFTVGFCVL